MKRKLLKLRTASMALLLLLCSGGWAFGQLTPACSPSYASSWASSTHNISSVTIGSFSHSPNYSTHDYTSQSFSLDAGSTTPISIVSNGWCGVGAAGDWNNDGDFDDLGEVLALPAYIPTDPATYTFNITIPPTVLTGSYRFRLWNIGANSTGGNPPGSPCGAYDYGSWVDYTVNVTNNASCVPPGSVNAGNIQPASADLIWLTPSTLPSGYIWKIVNQGDDPNIVAGVAAGYSTDTSATASGLASTTQYQLYVATDCGSNDTSAWSLPFSFTTPCNGTPDAGVASSTDSSVCSGISYTLSLDTTASEGPGISYQWQSSAAGLNTWVDISGDTALSMSHTQSAATDYRCIVTCSGSGLSDTSNVVSVLQNPASQCYCTPTYSNPCSSDDIIDDFILTGENATSINDIGTGCSSGNYDDRTSESLDLWQSFTYSGSVSSQTGGDNVRIWIDFNDDGLFESSETVATVSGVSSSSSSGFSLQVPATANTGSHRMRVRMAWNVSASSIDPCSNYGYGETHDYMANIIIPSGCLLPVNIAVSNITNDGATLSWNPPVVGDTAQGFDYEIRTSGAAGSGSAGLVMSDSDVVDTMMNAVGLVAGTTYTFYVRTMCDSISHSGWTAGLSFTLPTYVPLALTGFGDDVIANGIGAATSSTTNDVDGVGYALVAQDFQASASGPAPTQYVPNGGSITSGLKWFQLADYSGNNSLRLNGASQSGSLRLLAPRKASKVYVLGISGSGASTVNATIWFTDNTSQAFTGLSYPDWFATTGDIVASHVGRVHFSDNALGTGGPQLVENTLSLDSTNFGKQIDSISFVTMTGSHTMNVLAISIIPSDSQSCGLPASLSVANVTAHTADISWVGNGTSTDYQLSYSAPGMLADSGTIIDVPGATTSGLSSLISPFSYQVYVRSKCDTNDYSDWVGPVTFQTPLEPCTLQPSAGQILSTDSSVCPDDPFTLTAANATLALGLTYTWQSSPAGANTWDTLAATTPVLDISSQSDTTDYRFIVYCANSGLSDTAFFTEMQNPPTECYCIPTNSYSTSYYISSFSTTGAITNVTNNGTGFSPGGYGDYSATDTIVVVAGTTLNVSASHPSSTYNYKVWVDWNQDGDFDDPGENVLSTSSYVNSPYTGSFTVPTTALAGNTRLRIRNGYIGSPSACGSFNYGEAEDYTVHVILPVPCATATFPASVNALTNKDSLCSFGSESITLNLDTTFVYLSGVTYQWQSSANGSAPWTDIGTAQPGTSKTITGANTTTTWYRCQAVCGGTPAVTSDSIPVIVVEPQVVSVTDTSRCGPGFVTLAAQASTGSIIQWYASSTSLTPLGTGNTYNTGSLSQTDTFYVSARTELSSGNCESARQAVIAQIHPLPVVDLGNDTMLCPGAPNLVLDAGNPGSTYVWNTSATGQTLSISAASSYFVTVTDGFGCIGKDTIVVTTGTLPQNNLLDTVEVCDGSMATLDAGNAGASYAWNTSATSQSINVNTAGTYSVLITNPGGCTLTSTTQVVLLPLPIVDLGADTVLCPGSSISLNAGNAGSSYNWSNNATTQAITVTSAGAYSVTVTGLNSCSATDTIQIAAGSLPQNMLPATLDLCEGDTASLDAGNTGSTYSWSNNATSQSIQVSGGGNYSVTVTNPTGCVLNATTAVTLRPLPIIDLGPADTNLCEGHVLLLDAGNTGSNYLWNTGNLTETLLVSDSGTYSVMVTSPYNCVDSDQIEVSLVPAAHVDGIGFITLFNQILGKVQFTALNPVQVSSFAWTFGDGGTSSDENPSHIYTSSGDYLVTLTIEGNCGPFTDTLTIHVDLTLGIASVGNPKVNIMLYPNPARSSITIENKSDDIKMEHISIFNVLGACVYTADVAGVKQKEISVSNLAAGVYSAVIRTKNGTALTRKFEVVK